MDILAEASGRDDDLKKQMFHPDSFLLLATQHYVSPWELDKKLGEERGP